jgi:hypothetical protein
MKSDLEIWKKSFSEKKVLIVGTGPSLDRVNDNYFSKFDTILYVKHSENLYKKIVIKNEGPPISEILKGHKSF